MAPSMSVAEYYAGKSIFMTGATGFMGKVMVEKLLRSCPDVAKIFMLMRPKRGYSCKDRLDSFINNPIFDRLKNDNPKQFDKLQVIAGDILDEDLGISDEDRRLIQDECQIFFHGAACVRFDMFLRDAVKINTTGTRKVLELADGVKNLEVFLHVSTAYCRCEMDLLEEKLYPCKHRPQHVMQCTEWMDDDLLLHMQPKLIEPQPNTYAYTKSLTENLVAEYAGRFPIVIARPSIVTAAHKEPIPGWIDNMNGPTGLMVGAGKGVIRTMHCNDNYQADVVPVDMAVNACIVLTYLAGMEKSKDIKVCNVTQSGKNPITWGQALDLGRQHVREFPFSVCLWYPGGSTKTSWLQHQVALFFTHFLPAYFVDLLLYLLGRKAFMVKIQKRINYGLSVLQYYTTKEWHFKNDNFLALRTKLSNRDNETFYTDIEVCLKYEVINWSEYIRNYIKGAREYCCKEDPSNLPQARRLITQLYYLDKAVKIILGLLLCYLIYFYTNIIFSAVKVN